MPATKSKPISAPGPSFHRTALEDRLINKIAARAMTDLSLARVGDPFTKQDVMMDIAATNANGNPLRLKDLLGADGFNFAHDILGIRRHLDRRTGKLTDCFRPRFSKPSSP